MKLKTKLDENILKIKIAENEDKIIKLQKFIEQSRQNKSTMFFKVFKLNMLEMEKDILYEKSKLNRCKN